MKEVTEFMVMTSDNKSGGDKLGVKTMVGRLIDR